MLEYCVYINQTWRFVDSLILSYLTIVVFSNSWRFAPKPVRTLDVSPLCIDDGQKYLWQLLNIDLSKHYVTNQYHTMVFIGKQVTSKWQI